MNKIDKVTLEETLWKLCSLQDDITHMNETGNISPGDQPEEFKQLKQRRRELIDEIIVRVCDD